MEQRHSDTTNFISQAIKSIREMYKDGSNGFGRGSNGYWYITFKNGDEIVVDDFNVEWDGLPKLHANKIAKIESWFDVYGEIYTAHEYISYDKDDDYYKNLIAKDNE